MATGVTSWSQTPGTNASADSAVNFAEGQAPSTVNDSARGLMASVAKYRDDNNGSLTTGGSSTAYTITSNQGFASLTALDKQELTITMHTTSGATPTLSVDSLTAKPIRMATGATLPTGALLSGSTYEVTYYNTAGEFLIKNQTSLATNSLLGNVSGSTAAASPVTIGTGLVVSGTTLTAPATPPSSSFKNLSIKVASNTTVTVAADFVTMTDGTSFLTHSLSGTINLGTNGAANALDTGTIAIDTWYALHAIGKADGTTAGLASLSATSPTLPSGYTFSARIGWVRTIHASATLYGTWQLGRNAQYVVGLAQTSTLPTIASGSVGNVNTPTYSAASVSNFVPTTASEIKVLLSLQSASSNAIAAPNNSYGAFNSTTNPPPLNGVAPAATVASQFGTFLLESANVYWASTGVSNLLMCMGWTDNL